VWYVLKNNGEISLNFRLSESQRSAESLWSSLESTAVEIRQVGRLYLLPYCHQWIIWHDDKSFLMAPIIELLGILNVCWVFWRQQPAVAVISYPPFPPLIPSPLEPSNISLPGALWSLSLQRNIQTCQLVHIKQTFTSACKQTLSNPPLSLPHSPNKLQSLGFVQAYLWANILPSIFLSLMSQFSKNLDFNSYLLHRTLTNVTFYNPT
jgi:hypothetical protein